MAEIAQLGIEILSDDIVKATKRLDRLEGQSNSNVGANKKLSSSFGGLKSAITAIGIGALTKSLITNINTYTALSNKLKLVTKDAKSLADAQSALFDIAQDSRAPLEGTIDLYSRLARSTKSLNISSSELLGVTETINQAIAVSGSSASEASSSLFQLGQGLSAGALRGEELNSVMEQTPRLAQAIADGLGVGIAQLRVMGSEGKLNSQIVIEALKNQAGTIESEFSRTEKTIAQAFLQIENSALQTFGSIEGGDLVGALDDFRETISDPVIVKGLQGIAGAMISVTSALVTGLSKFHELGQYLGDTFGQIVTQAPKDVDSLNESLATLNAKAEGLKESIKGAEGRGIIDQLLYGSASGFETELQRTEEMIAKVEAEREKSLAFWGEQEAATDTPTSEEEQGALGAVSPIEQEEEFSQGKALEKLQEKYTLELDLLAEKMAAEQLLIDEAYLAGELSEAEHEQLMSDIAGEYADKRIKIADKEAASKARAQQKMWGLLTGLMDSGSKKLFKIGKAAAIAQATVDTYKGAQSAFADTPGPTPLKIAAAVAALAAGYGRIRSINSTSFGSGGSLSSSGGGGGGTASASTAQPVTTTQPVTEQVKGTQELRIVVEGDGPHSEGMRKFAENLAETVKDMGGVGSIVLA